MWRDPPKRKQYARWGDYSDNRVTKPFPKIIIKMWRNSPPKENSVRGGEITLIIGSPTHQLMLTDQTFPQKRIIIMLRKRRKHMEGLDLSPQNWYVMVHLSMALGYLYCIDIMHDYIYFQKSQKT